MPKRRGETGQYVETVALDDVLEVFDQVDGPPVITSADVADRTGLSRDSARRKLDELEERGDVRSRKTAGRVLYWRHSDGNPADTVEKAGMKSEGGEQGQSDRVSGSAEPTQQRSTQQEPSVDPDGSDALAKVEFPNSRDRAQCEAAVLAARNYLRVHGSATMRELVTEVMPSHPVSYEVPKLEPGDRYRGAWWRLVVKPGLKALPDVKAPKRGASEWQYIGD